MAISEFELHRFEKIIQTFCDEHGPSKDIHDQLKWGYCVNPKKQSVELFEIRPYFMDASKKIQIPFAKASFVKSKNKWKVYWMRGNGKWLRYEPCPDTKTLDEFLKVVKDDAYSCFFA